MSHHPTPRSIDLVATALGRALDDVVSGGGPLVPMSVHALDEGVDIRRYSAGRLEDALVEARSALGRALRPPRGGR